MQAFSSLRFNEKTDARFYAFVVKAEKKNSMSRVTFSPSGQ
jgi:hypothetical protein